MQASARVPGTFRVAWVSTDRKAVPSRNFAAFRGGMRELGYVEGVGFTIEPFWGEGSGERITELAGAVVGSRPGVVVAAGGLALNALLRSGVTTPIVFSMSADPVEAKVVKSFARPGGNATGISLFTLALVGKRMQLLREILPDLQRVAILANWEHPGEHMEYDRTQAAATQLGLSAQHFPVRTAAELDAALQEIARVRAGAIVVFADGFMLGFAGRIAAFSLQSRIPAIDGWAQFAREGNLMTYGPVLDDVYRRLAVFVDRILAGAAPAELPVELPTRVELVINLRVAKSLGIEVPRAMLLRADEVIQ